MKLKEMDGVRVIINTGEELVSYSDICEQGGWASRTSTNATEAFNIFAGVLPTTLGICANFGFAKFGFSDNNITLAEFKKEQGIMKYSAGDVLVNSNGSVRRIIQGNIGSVYISVDEDNEGVVETEEELDNCNYTLKTETTKTDMSVSEIEKALGKEAGSLNVVAE